MRVGILQFSPRLGEPERNQAHANELLAEAGLHSDLVNQDSPLNVCGSEHVDRNGSDRARSQNVDLLVLPEMAFSGYNFPDLSAIRSFLEPTAKGPSAQWAARTAARLGCLVAVGYPETTSTPEKIPSHVFDKDQDEVDSDGLDSQKIPYESQASSKRQQNFNSLVMVDPSGKIVAHYRKTHLYYTDATWASPSPSGFTSTSLPLSHPLQLPNPFQQLSSTTSTSTSASPSSTTTETTASFAICMDLNPQYFTAPWDLYEAASFAKRADASLLIASNAWITSKGAAALDHAPPTEPDWDTLAYWLDRFRPLLEADSDTHGGETLVVVANRTGIEPGPCRAFELDPAVRAAKRRARQEEREDEVVAKAARNEAQLADVPGAEAVAVQPPVLEGEEENEDDGDEKGTVFLEQVCYAGSSTIMALGGGTARVWGVLGRAEEGVLVADTMQPANNVWRLGKKERSEDEETHSEDTATDHDNVN